MEIQPKFDLAININGENQEGFTVQASKMLIAEIQSLFTSHVHRQQGIQINVFNENTLYINLPKIFALRSFCEEFAQKYSEQGKRVRRSYDNQLIRTFDVDLKPQYDVAIVPCSNNSCDFWIEAELETRERIKDKLHSKKTDGLKVESDSTLKRLMITLDHRYIVSEFCENLTQWCESEGLTVRCAYRKTRIEGFGLDSIEGSLNPPYGDGNF